MARASSAIDKRANEFLADDCGQNALQLASRGAALIAEILRLSEHIPQVFIDKSSAPQYNEIVSDFEYFKNQEEFEKRIENSAVLLERDEEFRLTHLELLERFFKLFRGIHGYAVELNRYISDIREAMYISQSLETILVHPDGKQLLCEVYYLFGVMLLLMDHTMGGKIREYLIVSFVRYKGAGDQVTVDVAHLCRATGYVKGKEPPERYPEQLFQRVPMDREVIEMIVGRIRSDDVYQAAFHYPAPEHRSTSLATQSSMLYVLLFFVPRVLDLEKQVMREIVDKHFVDNWVITYYLGYTVDLVVAWTPFKAAYAAIQGTINLETVSYHLDRNKKALVRLNPIVEGLLRDGVLTEQYVLDNISSTLLPTVRESNVTLRWFILHMTRGLFSKKESFKKSYAAVANAVSADSILSLLLGVAQLEFILKEMFEQLLKEKRNKWREAKETAQSKMTRLSQYFSGEHVLSESKVAALETWFADIASRIESLSYADSVTANRKVQKIMKALENVQEFHHVQDNLQVVQFLQDTRQLMRQMIRIINIERKVLISIDTVGDLSYAWELLATHRCFVDDIQRQIKNTPRLALQMRSVFIKLSTMLSIPCQRIFQAEVNDSSLASTLESVSEYYSTELVRFVNQVLHVIPVSIFEALKQIMNILVKELEPCPTRLNRSEMKNISQPETRRQLSRLTSEVSQFAAGILAMETTLVGVVKVEPHQLLEDGIRRELVAQVTQQLDTYVTYDKQSTYTAAQLDKMLNDVATKLGGIRAAFEYIQDYVNIHGLQIWLQEFSRIINFNVDMESNAFMSKKILPFQSQYQSDRIPIPAMQGRSERDAYSFVGRIQLHLLRMTRSAIFIPALGAWYELPLGHMAVGERTFNAILNAVGPQGLSAVDRVLCFSTAKELQTVIDENKKVCDAMLEMFEPIDSALTPTSGLPLEHYQRAYEMLSKPPFDKLLTTMGRRFHNIGRAQLIRTHIARELDANCKLQSTALHLALKAVNEGLLADIARHYNNPLEHPIPGQIIPQLNPFFDLCGVSHCQTKVYVTSRPVANLAFVIAALYVRLSGEFAYEPKYSCLVPIAAQKKGAELEGVIDAYSLASGTVTLLRQFHSEQLSTFLSLMAQFCRLLLAHYNVVAQEHRKKKPNETLPLGPRPAILTRMLENLMEVAGMPIHELGRSISSLLLEHPLEM